MNVPEYISSGIVESYVLGLASPEERSEFEQLCARYPEVLQARINFELALEKQAMANAVTPPAQLKARVMEEISSGGKVVALPPVSKSSGWLKYAAAACVILLAGSLYWNISLYNRNKTLQGNYDNTVARMGEMEKDIRVLQQNPAMKMAAMSGQQVSPSSYATVYWDTASHDVYLLINNMPKPPSDMQYQLWAFLDGQPVDMGLVEITEKPLQLYRLKKARAAQAFAITMEKKGRSDISVPGGDVYVLGKL